MFGRYSPNMVVTLQVVPEFRWCFTSTQYNNNNNDDDNGATHTRADLDGAGFEGPTGSTFWVPVAPVGSPSKTCLSQTSSLRFLTDDSPPRENSTHFLPLHLSGVTGAVGPMDQCWDSIGRRGCESVGSSVYSLAAVQNQPTPVTLGDGGGGGGGSVLHRTVFNSLVAPPIVTSGVCPPALTSNNSSVVL